MVGERKIGIERERETGVKGRYEWEKERETTGIVVVYIPPNSLKMKIKKHKFGSFSGRSL